MEAVTSGPRCPCCKLLISVTETTCEGCGVSLDFLWTRDGHLKVNQAARPVQVEVSELLQHAELIGAAPRAFGRPLRNPVLRWLWTVARRDSS